MICNRYSPFFFLFFVAALMGEEIPPQDPSCLNFGGGFTFLKQSQSSGNLGSFQTSYIYQSAGQLYIGVTFKIEGGSIYDSERKKWILDIDTQERLGYTFGSLDRKWILSLFSGLGYRYINQKEEWFGISFSSSHNDLYLPVGIYVEREINSRLRLGVLSEWKPQIYPVMTISSRDGIMWRTEKTLGNFIVEVPIKIKLHRNYQIYLALNPFIDFWQEGQTLSDFSFGLPIPEQTFLFMGINMDLSIYF